jgi:hypothetical protein
MEDASDPAFGACCSSMGDASDPVAAVRGAAGQSE